ncbi:MAG: class I SAM-dependent methyltransferase [Gammaproteobacteria bacterium]|nr:class I SAM-dependent methyltransferase [Pseudomonadales bacterium]MCP5349251.1 class I SAM-dependent methyltransferase [Pseudomonadales bacterium]
MSGFSIDWLNLREDADRRARDPQLSRLARQWLGSEIATAGLINDDPVVVDLGAGTGSTLRALTSSADHDPVSATWHLVDHDPVLLAEARRRHGGTHNLITSQADLADVDRLPLDRARLITASALFDLVSASFLDALTARLQARCLASPCGLYATLNYDGTTDWTPAHPLDQVVLAAFNRDQQRDKGFGRALGPDAADYLEHSFLKAGFAVSRGSSPWQLDDSDDRLISELIRGISHAVAGDAQLDASALEDWTRFRLSTVTSGTCRVGHTDLFIVPGQRTAQDS